MKRITSLVLILLSSCRAADTTHSDMIELQRVHANGVDVVLLSSDGTLSHGKDTLTVEFRRGDDLVDVGAVKAGATMPMAGCRTCSAASFSSLRRRRDVTRPKQT